MVWFFSALVFGFYLWMTPVRLGAVYRRGAPAAVRLGVLIGPVRVALLPSKKKSKGSMPPALRRELIRTLFERGALRRFSIDAVVSAPDAAQTALLCGLLRAAFCAVQASHPDAVCSSRVEPLFTPGTARFRISGIIELRLGHIMHAGFGSLMHEFSRRNHLWTSIRSKTS